MAFNSSSLALPPLSTSNSSLYTPHHSFLACFNSCTAFFISTAFAITKTSLLLPLSVLILHMAHQRRRSMKLTSHSDVFTYHMTVMVLTNALAWGFLCCGAYADLLEMMVVGFYMFSFTFPAQIFFHILTCVERYLAVEHAITYLRLSQQGGVRVRNVSIGCVWLLCGGWVGVTVWSNPKLPTIPFFCLLTCSIIVTSFCSLAVLRTLNRPGPGEVGGRRERVDQSKQRAFHTIVAIMGVLLLWFAGLLICIAANASHLVASHSEGCTVLVSGIWFSLPSSLVLPLLYLHRAGGLNVCSFKC